MLIYGWLPHGSKKVEHFQQLRPSCEESVFLHAPIVVFHDQEPLWYNMYSTAELCQELVKRNPTHSKDKIKYMSTLNLRSLTAPVGSFNDQVILVHSEQHSSDLEQYSQNNFIGVYFWSHAMIAADWFRYAEHDPVLDPQLDSIQHDFLVYNRAWTGTREYRIAFANELCRLELYKQCLTSFAPVDSGIYYKNHVFKNTTFAVDLVDIETVLPLNRHDSNNSADYNNLDYRQCGIEVVLETLFDDSRWHLTEKSLRPVACGRPFILMATPGSLEYLRSYGFETFSPWIDETYDSVQDPAKRMQAVLDEMQRISALPASSKQKLWQELYAISQRNKQLFFSKAWQHQIEHEFYTNLNTALTLLSQGPKGNIRRQFLKSTPDS